MSRRRSIYKLPRFKLRHKTIAAVGSLIAFILAVLSIVALFTHNSTLAFWRDFLGDSLGITKFVAPIIFFLSGLVLTKARWKLAQTNVLLGLILVVLPVTSLVAAIKYESSGIIGQTLWRELSSFITPPGSLVLLVLVFLIGLVVLFNTSLQQIFSIFGWVFNTVQAVSKSIFTRPRAFETKHIPIKVSGVDERSIQKPKQIQKETVV